MIGLREPLVLDREHRPFQRQPPLPGRLGLGPVALRSSPDPEWMELWSETHYMQRNVDSLAREYAQTPWIHQPFIVRRVSFDTAVGAGTGRIWSLVADAEVPAGTMDAQRGEYSPVWGPSEASNFFEHLSTDMSTSINPGTIIRNVPTRLTWIVYNASGVAAAFSLFIDVTYLAPYPKTPNPRRGCSRCPLEIT